MDFDNPCQVCFSRTVTNRAKISFSVLVGTAVKKPDFLGPSQDAQNVCAVGKVGTILKLVYKPCYWSHLFQNPLGVHYIFIVITVIYCPEAHSVQAIIMLSYKAVPNALSTFQYRNYHSLISFLASCQREHNLQQCVKTVYGESVTTGSLAQLSPQVCTCRTAFSYLPYLCFFLL